MSNQRPEPGTPEFAQWLAERAERRAEGLFHSPADFKELGEIAGSREAITENDKPKIVKKITSSKSED